MMIVNPERALLGETVLHNTVAVMVDFGAGRLVEEWSDAGPHAAFVDVPESKVRVTVVQRLAQTDLDPPRPGLAAPLAVVVAANLSDRGRVVLLVEGVVVEVKHSYGRDGGERRIVIAGVSGAGGVDPVALAAAGTMSIPGER